jgi:hypothetical protein
MAIHFILFFKIFQLDMSAARQKGTSFSDDYSGGIQVAFSELLFLRLTHKTELLNTWWQGWFSD